MKTCLISILLGIQLLCPSVWAKNIKADGLQRSTPEAEGISSSVILQYIDAVEKKNLGMHSFMLLRHGKVIAEGWWKPYQPELRHIVHSVSKMFVSTAVGFAIDEKLMTLDDKVMCFFPEYLPDTITPYLEQLTIRHLLTMSAGNEPAPVFTSADGNWVKAFLATPLVNKPGSKFVYSSYATYMVSAILQRVTGQPVRDYLRPRLFEPLGIYAVLWEESPAGINCGGWGLRLKTSDLAKLGQLYLQRGKWQGKQLLSASWIEEATTSHISPQPDLSPDKCTANDWAQGYGYYIWRCCNNAFRADGSSGQYIIVMPDQDMVMAITSESPDMKEELNLVWKYFLPAVKDKKLPNDKDAYNALMSKMATLSLPMPFDKTTLLDDKTVVRHYSVEPNELHINHISVKVVDDKCFMTLVTDDASHEFVCGNGQWIYDKTERKSPYFVSLRHNSSGLSPFDIAGCFAWKNKNVLQIRLLYLEDNTFETFSISDDGEEATVTLYRTSNTKLPDVRMKAYIE